MSNEQLRGLLAIACCFGALGWALFLVHQYFDWGRDKRFDKAMVGWKQALDGWKKCALYAESLEQRIKAGDEERLQ